jgi:site-specific recombinase XerD
MEDQLKDFIHFLIVEKGLAKNTIISYERDLKSYIHYVNKVENVLLLNDVQRVHIVHFLGFLKEQQKSSKETRPLDSLQYESKFFEVMYIKNTEDQSVEVYESTVLDFNAIIGNLNEGNSIFIAKRQPKSSIISRKQEKKSYIDHV